MTPADHPAVRGDHTIRSLLALLRPHRRRISAATLAFVVKDSPFWVMPIITANIIDAVVAGNTIRPVLVNGGVGAVVVLLNLPSNAVFVRNLSATVRDVGVNLRNALTHHLQELSIGFHNRLGASVTQSKVVRDVENVELMMQQTFAPVMSSVGVLIGACVVTALRVPAFIAVFLVLVPLAAFLVRWVRHRSRERNEAFRRQVEQLSNRVGEMASLTQITRAHGLEHVAADRVATSARGVRDAGVELDRLNGRFGALSWASYQTLGVLCLVFAATLSLTKTLDISPGEVVLLSTYFTILTNSVTNTFALAPIVTRGQESLRSIAEVLQDRDLEDNRDKPPVSAVAGRLVFDSVSFRYPGAEADVVTDVTLHVEPGQTVAFVGPSGSGKSTLVNLALGFLRPSCGRILLDEVDTATVDLRTARRFFSVVPQDPVLFEGSIRENVTYGLEGATDAMVRRALTDANAWDFVQEMEQGWDTRVGGLGTGLSGGQRQRLAIARALIRDPKVLILDEATSALDAQAESVVQETLTRLRHDRTILVVAHRLATVRPADLIVVLDHGHIVERGTHAELMAHNGVYAGMTAQQSG